MTIKTRKQRQPSKADLAILIVFTACVVLFVVIVAAYGKL
jgi:hypothetical protein